jgi:lipid-A-disaccharide synthase
MVVAYRLSAATVFVARRLALVKSPYMALPNLLAGRPLVPEFFQDEVTAQALGSALLRELDDPARTATLVAQFRRMHVELRTSAAERAANAILECAGIRA